MDVRIEYTYRTPKGTESFFYSEVMRAEKALLMVEDIERTGRAKKINFVDTQDQTWNLKELKEFLKGIETEPHNVSVYFDGGHDRYSKRSGLGCVIYYEQNGKSFRLRKNALIEELDTNNEAEYAALHFGVMELEYLGVHHQPVSFIGDSQVVINQMSEEWPCYEEELSKWADRIDEQLNRLGIKPDFKSVSRKQNQEADRLASQALKNVEIMSTSEQQE